MNTLLAATFLSAGAAHAAPVDLAWNARLLDADGTPLQGSQSLHIYLCDSAEDPCSLWDAAQALVADDGYVSTVLSVTTTVLDNPEVWIDVRKDGTPLGPRQKLVDAPYAGIARGIGIEGAAASADCTGDEGAMVFDTTIGTVRVCVDGEWSYLGEIQLMTVDGAYRYVTGDNAPSCEAYRRPAAGLAGSETDGLYWLDPDGAGPNAAFKGWCDQTLDGGGWLLVGWSNGNGPGTGSYAYNQGWAPMLGSTATITPSARGYASYLLSMNSQLGGAALDTRLTYHQADQSTLDIAAGTTRAFTHGSTWTGAKVTSNPLPSTARNTVAHNCTHYTYVNASGATSTLNAGCYIEFTEGHAGGWAGCGSNGYTSGRAAWNLCFDNGDATDTVGNSVLGLWHAGAPGYHEVYEHNFGTGTAANTPDTWNSFGGHWTWSAWLRAN